MANSTSVENDANNKTGTHCYRGPGTLAIGNVR
jgi:hypothetical protein